MAFGRPTAWGLRVIFRDGRSMLFGPYGSRAAARSAAPGTGGQVASTHVVRFGSDRPISGITRLLESQLLVVVQPPEVLPVMNFNDLTPPIADVSWGGFRIIDLAAGVDPTDAVNVAQMEAGDQASKVLAYSKRTSNFTFVSDGSTPVVLPADVGDLGCDALDIPNWVTRLKVTIRIPQFQMGGEFVGGEDIFFELGDANFDPVFGAHEWTVRDSGSQYRPVEFTSIIDAPPDPLTLKVRLMVNTAGRTILEAGGYEDPNWRAPAYMLVEAI